MTPYVDQLVEAFLQERASQAVFEQLFAISSCDPKQISVFVIAFMERISEGSTVLGTAFGLLAMENWDEVIQAAMKHLRSNPAHEGAADAIAYASLQCPDKLSSYVEELFRLQPNENAYYSAWFCRAAHEKDIEQWIHTLHDAEVNDPAFGHSLNALLEARTEPALRAVIERIERLHRDGSQAEAVRYPLDLLLEEAGYRLAEGELEQLHGNMPYHLVFRPEDFTAERPVWFAREQHPTWGLSPATPAADDRNETAMFGGRLAAPCSVCGQPIHRLLTLERIPDGVLIASLSRITLGVCLSCLGWEEGELFCVHDEQGEPYPHPSAAGTEPQEPQFPAEALRDAMIKLVPASGRWQTQDWALSNSRENLNRLGGMPSWIQGADYLHCPHCSEKMAFIAQLDSDLPTSDGEEWMWGSGGIAYMFWCDGCRVSGYRWQCT